METKLTARDIMVGDYTKHKDGTVVQVARVGNVSPMDAQVYCRTQSEGYFPCQLADLAPIPLTTEILDKNFEKDTYENYSYYEISDDFCIRNNFGRIYLAQWIGSEHSMTQYPKRIVYLESVEQLQHAMRLLSIDKEIVL